MQTAFLLLAFLSYVSFKENWQDKDRTITCPKDASQEEADSLDDSYFVPFRNAFRML